jgi:hypothetical protein
MDVADVGAYGDAKATRQGFTENRRGRWGLPKPLQRAVEQLLEVRLYEMEFTLDNY